MVLKDSILDPDGVEVTSKFEMRLDSGTLGISDATAPLFSLVDQSDRSHLMVAGDGMFVSPADGRSVSVESSVGASSLIASGVDANATMTITAGPNFDSVFAFTGAEEDCLSGSSWNSIFELELVGSALKPPQYSAADSVFEISDGGGPLTALLRITDTGDTADLQVSGSLVSQNLHVKGDALFGSTRCHPTYCPFPYDSMHIAGHLTEDLYFDRNMDDHSLTVRFVDPPEHSTVISFPDESGLVLTNVSTRSSLTSVGALEFGSIATGFGPIMTGGNVETIGPRASGTCTGVANDPVATPDCTDSFEAKDDDASSCAPGCVYTPKITMDITVVGKVTATDSFHARGDTYLGDRVDDEIVLRGVVESFLHFGYEASEPYGPEIPIGTDADGSIITTRFVRDKSQRIFFQRDAVGSKQTVISARFHPSTVDSPPGERLITIPDVPSGGTIHVATKALGRVNGGASCTTPNCILIVQGRTPTSGIVIEPNQVLMDTTSGVIEGKTGLKPGWEEQMGLINRLIKPGTILVANIEDYGRKGMPMVQAVRVDPAGGQATIVIRNIATDPTEQVDQRYSVSWAIFN